MAFFTYWQQSKELITDVLARVRGSQQSQDVSDSMGVKRTQTQVGKWASVLKWRVSFDTETALMGNGLVGVPAHERTEGVWGYSLWLSLGGQKFAGHPNTGAGKIRRDSAVPWIVCNCVKEIDKGASCPERE